MKTRLGRFIRYHIILAALICLVAIVPRNAIAAPFAELVMDARTGEVLYSRNADTRLYPASLTKMMTLYITFEAIRNGEITLDTMVRISKKAAREPPSKLGMRPGQKIKLRYLIRAAAIKSANDAATAIGEAVGGSEAAFARRMNRTAKALGMTRSTFKNANGLTRKGHLSTARDMATLARHLFYDFPSYYNLFSRRTASVNGRKIFNTNRKFLAAYRGADGIKTGYTAAAGFNLVGSARRGNVRVIGVIFGGRSTAARNAKMAALLNLGFRRARKNVPTRKPLLPVYADASGSTPNAIGKTIRVNTAVRKSLRPQHRPSVPQNQANPADMLLAMRRGIRDAVAETRRLSVLQPEKTSLNLLDAPAPANALIGTTLRSPSLRSPSLRSPSLRPPSLRSPSPTAVLTSIVPEPRIIEGPAVVVSRLPDSENGEWGINVGRYPSRYKAERVLLKTALAEMSTLDGTVRRIVKKRSGYDADFVGLSRETAALACRRLTARDIECSPVGPS